MTVCTYDSPVGRLKITTHNDFLASIHFHAGGNVISPTTRLLSRICQQLDEYFSKQRETFALPVQIDGTSFQINVWKTLQTIPYGQVQTYKFIAEKIGNPKAVRAVGQAIHRNSIPIIIPCHRIIGTNGSLTGYAPGLEIKQYLLGLENPCFNPSKI